LIAAIHMANANGVDDTINLQGDVYTLTGVDNDAWTDPHGLHVGPNGLLRAL
jgi:hypothetical protein